MIRARTSRIAQLSLATSLLHFLTTVHASLLSGPIELVALHRDGHEFPVEATVWPVRVRGVCQYNAFARDISERRRAEEARKKEATLVGLLQSVTVAANRSSNIEHTAQTCLNRICAHMGWPVGHIYLCAINAPEELTSTGIWHIAEEGLYGAFRGAGDRLRLTRGTGLPGETR